MALTDIYVLPSHYAKFDWADWPDSADALVSGGYTHEFEKECWNAIVDLLAQALTDAGLSWNTAYTTHNAARITEKYGDLYANAINSVRHNIETAVPAKLRWGWANDPTFRGYIGRKDFRGVDVYGEDGADDVYPEYIAELAARLNFMLSVMTGEAAKVLRGGGMAETLNSAELLAKPPYYLTGSGQGYSIHEASGIALPSRALGSGQIIRSLYDATLRRGVAAQMGHKYLFRTDYKAKAEHLPVRRLGGHRYNLVSKYLAEMDIYNARPISARHRSWSISGGEMAQSLPWLLGSFRRMETSLYTAESAAVQSLRLEGRNWSTSNYGAEIAQTESYPVTAQGKAATLTDAKPDKLGIAPMDAGTKVVSIHAAALKRAARLEATPSISRTLLAAALYLRPPGPLWLDPVQTGSNLYIRSVWGSYQDQGEINIDLDVFYKTVQSDGNLYIRSVDYFWIDGDAGNVDSDVFLQPVQEGSNLYIRQDIFGGEDK